ncbi:hypothetical protein [Natronosalvus halobius]|uniref:hypothetical protein n=1 Tax=Natronosalvus halobius TaxID=2953746 RepID=UPI00209E259C|nr:hypothetical protein [Natronosalvus halobius]USZ70395.1 hypothetical protein NGM15_09705 [Natronosalvus halobius]
MPSTPTYSRRTVLGLGLGGLGTTLTAAVAWGQRSDPGTFRIASLYVVNDSSERATVEIAVGTDLETARETTRWLDPAGHESGRDRQAVRGPWHETARPYGIRVRLDDESIQLSSDSIEDQLEPGWGVTEAHVAITVTPDRLLEADVFALE